MVEVAMASSLAVSLDPDAGLQRPPGLPAACRQPEPPAGPRAMSLHLSKLRGMTNPVRQQLKRQGIVYTHQLIEAAQDRRDLRRLAAASGIDEDLLERLTLRADLTRINGIGAIFADMLEHLDVDGTLALAGQDPAALHDAIARLNAVEQLARRAPTPEEVQSWVAQAAALAAGTADRGLSDSS
jgi:predicted flap endonuclease-1-like 5' DNA nuclease